MELNYSSCPQTQTLIILSHSLVHALHSFSLPLLPPFRFSPASKISSSRFASPQIFKPFRISCISSVDPSKSTAVLEKPSLKFKTQAGSELVIFGGGHAAFIAFLSAGRGQVNPSAIAPTWAAPLPIVFSRGSDLESRYGLLSGTLRASAVGWMMYNLLVSNEKSIQSQYKSHVYADSDNVTSKIIQCRYSLMKRKEARIVPAAFLTDLLDPLQSQEEFLALFAKLEGKIKSLLCQQLALPRGPRLRWML